MTDKPFDILQKEAERKISKALSALILDQPFFGALGLMLKIRPMTQMEAARMPTMGTDGERLVYDPAFVISQKDDVLKSAMCHEILHCAFAHMFRLDGRNPTKWNIACDYAINPLIKDSGMPVPKGWLYSKDYEDMEAEQIYSLLPDPPEQPQNGNGEGEGEDEGNEGEGGGKGKDPNDHSQGCGWMMRPNRMSEAEKNKAIADAKVKTAQARNTAKMQGNMPAGLERLIGDFLHPSINWKDKLRRFLEIVSRNDYTWMVPNRRFHSAGFVFPSLHSNDLGEMAVIIDTSGSVSEPELAQFGAELSSIISSLKPEKVHVIYVDADVAGYDEYGPSDLPLNLKPKGGGGTDFRPGFDFIERNGIMPRCVIYFTDMYCNSFPDTPDYPVLWASSTKVDEVANFVNNVPFGEVIQVELDERQR